MSTKLRIARLVCGLSQSAIERLGGPAQYRLSRIEAGVSRATEEEKQALSRILGLPEAELFEEQQIDGRAVKMILGERISTVQK